jgi:hypothetical protein
LGEDFENSDCLSLRQINKNMEELRQVIRDERLLTINDVYTVLGLSSCICRRIVTEDENTRRIAAEFTPRIYTPNFSVQRPARSDQKDINFFPRS